MFGSKRPPAAKEIGSLVGAGTSIRGDIVFHGGMRIDGEVIGNVLCSEGEKGGMLVISEHGRVAGEVRAAHLVVAGSIAGPVYASQMVELQPKARIVGDLHYKALEMHHGAVIDGTLFHDGGPGRPATPLQLGVAPGAADNPGTAAG